MKIPPNIFVFGSNTQGRHGKGAALYAKLNHGAIYGQAEGLQGESYAIITKELRKGYPGISLLRIHRGVIQFLTFARLYPESRFQVSPIGCGLAGYQCYQIAPFFAGAPANVILPHEFRVHYFDPSGPVMPWRNYVGVYKPKSPFDLTPTKRKV